MPTLGTRFALAQAGFGSTAVVLLCPNLTQMPLPLLWVDDPFLPWSKALISALAPHTCGFMFDVPGYLALGAAGAVALERALAYVPTSHVRVLHGPFADDAFAPMLAATAFDAHAATVMAGAAAGRFANTQEGRGAFVLALPDALINASVGAWHRGEDGAPAYLALRESDRPVCAQVFGRAIVGVSRGDDYANAAAQALVAASA